MKHSPVKGLEYALAAMFKQAQACNAAVDGTTIREEAWRIAVFLGVYNFTASNGWINRYKNRHNTEFDVHVTMHHDKFLTIKPTRCTNFSKLILE